MPMPGGLKSNPRGQRLYGEVQGAETAPIRRRGRPNVRSKHERWKQEHDQGKSFGQIALDEKVSRRAVVKALANLG